MKKTKIELDEISPFQGISAAKKRELESLADKKDSRTREVIFENGANADRVYLLLAGGVKLVRKGAGRRTHVVDFVAPGSLFGYAECLVGSPRTEDAISLQPGCIISWPFAKFMDVVSETPGGTKSLMTLLATKIKADQDMLEEQAVQNLKTRLVRLIYRLAKDFGQKGVKVGTLVNLRVTHQEIADHLGASRESVTVTISQLRKQKMVKLDVRKLVVPDMRLLLKA